MQHRVLGCPALQVRKQGLVLLFGRESAARQFNSRVKIELRTGNCRDGFDLLAFCELSDFIGFLLADLHETSRIQQPWARMELFSGDL